MSTSLSILIVVILFSGVYSFDVIGERRGTIRTAHNLRPCASDNQFITIGTQDYFMTRCLLLLNTQEECDSAYQLFLNVIDNNNTSPFYNDDSPPNYSAYINFFNFKKYMQTNNLQPVFYSGSGQCPDVVHTLTSVPDIALATLEDMSGPYMIANAAWCAAEYFNATDGLCTNETTWGRVPNGDWIVDNYEGAAYWGAASDAFAQASYETTWALLRSFESSGWNFSAFRGIFRYQEFPLILQQTAVTNFNVMVITNSNQPNETCGGGSIEYLESMAIDKWGVANTRCIADPPCVLQFVCDPATKEWELPLVNKDLKCKYWESVKDKVTTNCVCSTDGITQNSDGSWNLPFGCPRPTTNSAASLVTLWTFVFSVLCVVMAF